MNRDSFRPGAGGVRQGQNGPQFVGVVEIAVFAHDHHQGFIDAGTVHELAGQGAGFVFGHNVVAIEETRGAVAVHGLGYAAVKGIKDVRGGMLGGLSSGHAVDGVVGVGALAVEEQIAVPVVVLGDPAGRGILIQVVGRIVRRARAHHQRRETLFVGGQAGAQARIIVSVAQAGGDVAGDSFLKEQIFGG